MGCGRERDVDDALKQSVKYSYGVAKFGGQAGGIMEMAMA